MKTKGYERIPDLHFGPELPSGIQPTPTLLANIRSVVAYATTHPGVDHDPGRLLVAGEPSCIVKFAVTKHATRQYRHLSVIAVGGGPLLDRGQVESLALLFGFRRDCWHEHEVALMATRQERVVSHDEEDITEGVHQTLQPERWVLVLSQEIEKGA